MKTGFTGEIDILVKMLPPILQRKETIFSMSVVSASDHSNVLDVAYGSAGPFVDPPWRFYFPRSDDADTWKTAAEAWTEHCPGRVKDR